jgi:hypothetical protein
VGREADFFDLEGAVGLKRERWGKPSRSESQRMRLSPRRLRRELLE